MKKRHCTFCILGGCVWPVCLSMEKKRMDCVVFCRLVFAMALALQLWKKMNAS